MNQNRITPESERVLPDWAKIERKSRMDLKQLRKVPDFDQMLLNHAKQKKRIPLRAVYVYLPEHASQFRASVQAGLQQLPSQPIHEPPGGGGPPPASPPVTQASTAAAPPSAPAPSTNVGSAGSNNPGSPPPRPGDQAAPLSPPDPISQLAMAHRVALTADDNVRLRARHMELQDEMIKVRIHAEEQARRTAFIEANVERMRLQPQAVPIPVVHQHTNVSNTLVQPIANFVNNVQTNFHNVSNNVHVVHNQALNFIQNNANKAINMAVTMGTTLANSYDTLPAPRPATAAILDGLVTGGGGNPPPPPPAAGAVRVARSIRDGRSSPYTPLTVASPPQPLAPSSSSTALPVAPLTIEDREAPYVVPVNPKKKPRKMEIKDAYRPKTDPPLPDYLPPPMPNLPPRFALEDAPVRVKQRSGVIERTPRKRPAPEEVTGRSDSTMAIADRPRRRRSARVRVVPP